jgi:hypothetical protein
MRPDVLGYTRVPTTPSGIEPATLQLVAQCLIQLCHRVPHDVAVLIQNTFGKSYNRALPFGKQETDTVYLGNLLPY